MPKGTVQVKTDADSIWIELIIEGSQCKYSFDFGPEKARQLSEALETSVLIAEEIIASSDPVPW
jgi:hypothetical protein